MGVSVDTGGGGGRKSVDAHIELVPFIDMMSCMVAFLLISAVWTNLAQLNVKPKGIGRDAEQQMPTEPPINVSVLVASDSHWIGITTGQRTQIKKIGESYDWTSLEEVLGQYKSQSIFASRKDIE